MNKSVGMSIPEPREVHGVMIKKLPLGKYMAIIQELGALSGNAYAKLFLGKDLGGLLDDFRALKPESLIEMIQGALMVVPESAIRILGIITDLPEERITEDFGLIEIRDILQACWEVNQYEDFLSWAGKVVTRVKLPQSVTSGGSKL